MRQWLRSHLTYANVMVTILAFIVLSGGTAVALSGSNTVFTDDIANDTFNSPTQGQGGLVAADLRPNSVGTSEVANDSLTGADIHETTLSGVNASTLGGLPDSNYARNAYASTGYLSSVFRRYVNTANAQLIPVSLALQVQTVSPGARFKVCNGHTASEKFAVYLASGTSETRTAFTLPGRTGTLACSSTFYAAGEEFRVVGPGVEMFGTPDDPADLSKYWFQAIF